MTNTAIHPTTQTTDDQVGACGCIRHADQTWTLCAECDARIGKVGTCLACGGPADEWWTIPGFDDVSGCSPECAAREAAEMQEMQS